MRVKSGAPKSYLPIDGPAALVIVSSWNGYPRWCRTTDIADAVRHYHQWAAAQARIARDLHDAVAHNVSVMVVQADGASLTIGTSVYDTASFSPTPAAGGGRAFLKPGC